MDRKYCEVDNSLKFGRILANPTSGEEVVISGISGRYPESLNTLQLSEHLFNKRDLVTDDERRWKRGHPEIPQRLGKISIIDEFDAGQFGVNYRQGMQMDPKIRLLLEVATESIFDAGLHLSDLQRARTGVFIASCYSESEQTWYCEKRVPNGFAITGHQRSMLANQVSFSLGLKGPSINLDSACSSSLFAVEHAYKAIRMGQCDFAIVGGSHLCLHPGMSLHFARLGVLSPDGCCKVFDKAANGYVRAEAVCAVLLQKAKDAKRIYSTILHAKSNCDGFKNSGITYPSGDMQACLLRTFYKECDRVTPQDVTYLEAHGTGTKVGDVEELSSVDQIFGKGREPNNPILVGSVKTNTGHTEISSGITAIHKVIIAAETNYVPPNIHLTTNRSESQGLEEGRIKVVTEPTYIGGTKGILGVSGFGFGGANCHVLLQRNAKTKVKSKQTSNAPILLCASGRNMEAVDSVFHYVGSSDIDMEQIGLFHEVFSKNIKGHSYRGFAIFSQKGEVHVKSSDIIKNTCLSNLILSVGVIKRDFMMHFNELINLPRVKSTLKSIQNFIPAKHIALKDILVIPRASVFNRIMSNFVVQLTLVDLLKTCNITPAKIVGVTKRYCLGFLVCAYSDDILTMEETVHYGYYIASAADFNTREKVLTQLQSELELRRSSCSKYIAEDSVMSLEKLKLNLNYCIFEIGNGDYSQASSENQLNLVRCKGSIIDVLASIGKLYQFGFNPQIQNLYHKLEFPVSRGTPMLSPALKWRHDRKWWIPTCENKFVKLEEKRFTVSTKEPRFSYLNHYILNGRVMFPATGYFWLVWETLADMHDVKAFDMKIVFENCVFKRNIDMALDCQNDTLDLSVTIQKASGQFEVMMGCEPVVVGKVHCDPADSSAFTTSLMAETENDAKNFNLVNKNDIYKELHLRGYNYGDQFKRMENCDSKFERSQIQWDGNWVVFLDNMLQMKFLQQDTRLITMPISIRKLVIDAREHAKLSNSMVDVYADKRTTIIRSEYVEIRGLDTKSVVPKAPQKTPLLEKHIFVPSCTRLTKEVAIRVNIQLILENWSGKNFKIVEVVDQETAQSKNYLGELLHETFDDIPLIHPTVRLLSNCKLQAKNAIVDNKNLADLEWDLLVGRGLLQQHNVHISSHDKTFSWVTKLQKEKASSNPILLVAQADSLNGILGLVKCLLKEPDGQLIKVFFIMEPAPEFSITDPFYQSQLKKNLVINVYKNGQWGTYRHLLLEQTFEHESNHCCLQLPESRDKLSLAWVEGPYSVSSVPSNLNILVNVNYAALNVKDLMITFGTCAVDEMNKSRLRQVNPYGLEFSGTIENETKRVMGMTLGGACTSVVEADPQLLWEVPVHWSLQEAATVPLVYLTAIHGLVNKCNLQYGESILIHCGSDGLGLAAIHLALYFDCTVYTTVDTEEKRQFLKRKFPQLKDYQVTLNNSAAAFESHIKHFTNGRGVDVVLNFLVGTKVLASIRCLAHGGRFLNVGKVDLLENQALNLEIMEKNISFYCVTADANIKHKSELKKQFQHFLDNKAIVPLRQTLFKKHEVESAIKYIGTGKLVGKVVLEMRKEMNNNTNVPAKFSCTPRYYCDPDKSYLICGGLGGFGLELVDWLILRNCRKLVLTSRSGIKSGYQWSRINIWRSYGCQIKVCTDDVTTTNGCQNILKTANEMGTVHAIFNLMIDLNNSMFPNQTAKSFDRSFGPKVVATTHLDLLSRKMCPHLRDFVVFSSTSSGRGFAGQTNYGMANSGMERICEERRRNGYPALAIQWGIIGDVGIVAERQDQFLDVKNSVRRTGTLPQEISSCLKAMDLFLKQTEATVVSSFVMSEKGPSNDNTNDVIDLVAGILGIHDLKSISFQASFSEIGMDSMTVVEIKHALEREFDLFLRFKDLKEMTFAKLMEIQRGRIAEKQLDATKELKIAGLNMLVQEIPVTENASSFEILRSRTTNLAPSNPVIVIPGIDGDVLKLKGIYQQLEEDILSLRFTNDQSSISSVKDLANIFLPQIFNAISKTVPFKILSFSFGGSVALEIAKTLEERGYKGTIILVDGSPNYLKEIARFLEIEGEDKFQMNLIVYILTRVYHYDEISKLAVACAKQNGFEERLDMLLSGLEPNPVCSSKYLVEFIVSIYKRLKALLKWTPETLRLKSAVRLFKPKSVNIEVENESIALGKLCQYPQQANTTEVDGDHFSILSSPFLHESVKEILAELRQS